MCDSRTKKLTDRPGKIPLRKHVNPARKVKNSASFFVFISKNLIHAIFLKVHVPNFGELSGSEDRGGGDNSIQIINFGRVADSFEEWRQKVEGWKGG